MPRNSAKIDYPKGIPIGFNHFVVIKDPGVEGHQKLNFGEAMFFAVSALVCGVQSFLGRIEFAHIHQSWLKKWVRLPIQKGR